jgi:hypothetical protein
MKNWIWPLVVVLIVAGVAGFAYYVNLQHPPAPPPARAAAAASAPPAAEPQTHYPIEPAAPPPKPLPPLDQSDAEVSESLAALFSRQTLIEMFQIKGLIRRIVATVDNLPRDRVAGRLMAVNRVPGQFAIAGGPGNLSISAGNYSRYAAYARVAQSLDAQKLVAVYVHLYPLFQQAYVELGYPKGYFNDRLVQVIDNLLAAPSPHLPVSLEQPNVLYTYADPDLESLSAGQKMLIRMGPENAAVVKEKLREIRAAVTSSGLKH